MQRMGESWERAREQRREFEIENDGWKELRKSDRTAFITFYPTNGIVFKYLKY